MLTKRHISKLTHHFKYHNLKVYATGNTITPSTSWQANKQLPAAEMFCRHKILENLLILMTPQVCFSFILFSCFSYFWNHFHKIMTQFPCRSARNFSCRKMNNLLIMYGQRVYFLFITGLEKSSWFKRKKSSWSTLTYLLWSSWVFQFYFVK